MSRTESGQGVPPITAHPNPPPVVILTVGVVFLLLLVGILRRRQNLGHNLRNLMKTALVAGVALLITSAIGWNRDQSVFSAVIVGLLYLFAFSPRRSRYTPAQVRRRVIARWEADTGNKFNSRRWEVDHIIPFAQGGSHTEDNLRVIDKKRNRSKGSKSPRWDLLGRH